MEDALVRDGLIGVSDRRNCVLILVLMEDALVLNKEKNIQTVIQASLNPCFNGRCTRTST